jgi:ABC-2 type transport system permease protein
MTGFGVLLAKEVTEAWRTLRLPVVAGVLLLAGIISPLLARFTPEIVEALAGQQAGLGITFPTPTIADSVAQVLKNVGQFGALAAIVLAMGSVAGEVDRGTAAFVLVKPVSRAAFVAAKLVTIGLVLAIGTGLGVVAAAVYTAILFQPLDPAGWLGLALALWLSLAAYASIAFLGSAVARSTVGGAAIGVGGLVVIGLASVVPTLAPLLPGGLAAIGGELALGRPVPDLVRSVVATIGLITSAVAASAWLFSRREL